MEYQVPKSNCNICQSEFAGRGMTRHLKTCLEKHLAKESKGEPENLYYLHAKDTFNPDYFLHVLMREDSFLEDLDRFLRDIWLECCGHLSAFSYERYGDEIDMEKEIKDVFTPVLELMYRYDFGSTTELFRQSC